MILRSVLSILLVPVALAAAPSLEEIVADPRLWPAEVTVTSATRATAIRNGAPGGVMLVGAGRKLTVTAIAADGITGKLGGDLVKVPVDRTDLFSSRAEVSAVPATPSNGAPPAAAKA
jgi:hypothetical protein